ncbi:MAG: PEGA domain-containing protein [Brevinematales bacterium]|nr:PEGA domain-containing protein [Brevinematales bacterium]
MKFRFVFLAIFSVLFISCGPSLIKQTEDAKKAVQDGLIKSYTRDLKIEMDFFTNLSGAQDINYLSKALPEMLYAYLKPIEVERASIDFSPATLSISKELEKVILDNKMFFSNYITNVESMITQRLFALATNTNFFDHVTNYTKYLSKTNTYQNIILTNFSMKIQWKNTNIITNMIIFIYTNYTGTNVIKTNLNRVFVPQLYSLITNEYPALKESFSLIPVSLVKKFAFIATNAAAASKATNLTKQVSTNAVQPSKDTKVPPKTDPKKDVKKDVKPAPVKDKTPPAKDKTPVAAVKQTNTVKVTNAVKPAVELKPYTVYINGSYKIKSQGKGPTEIEVTLNLIKVAGATNTNVYKLVCREDQLSDKILEFLKPIRELILSRPSGDLIILTEPAAANVYLDGSYLGKSPLFYPAVLGGKHQIAFIKDGYNLKNIAVNVLTNMTNIVSAPISKLNEGGMVYIGSYPTNCLVFIDSIYMGNTPLQVSNLTIGVEHRVKILTGDTNEYKPFYTIFKLNNPDQEIMINAWLRDYQEVSPKEIQKAAWIAAYSGWGLTLAAFGVGIYTHYQSEYNYDLYNVTHQPVNKVQGDDYQNIGKTCYTISIITAIAAAGLTHNALYQERVYLGLDKISSDEVNAFIKIKY